MGSYKTVLFKNGVWKHTFERLGRYGKNGTSYVHTVAEKEIEQSSCF